MSQSPAVAWEASPADTNQEPSAPVVEVKVEDFDTVVEQRARDQIATIKLQTDAQRMNKAVDARVAELVQELGLPPPKTEDETIDTLTESFVEAFEIEWIKGRAHARAREIFFNKYPAARTAEKKGVKESVKQ